MVQILEIDDMPDKVCALPYIFKSVIPERGLLPNGCGSRGLRVLVLLQLCETSLSWTEPAYHWFTIKT